MNTRTHQPQVLDLRDPKDLLQWLYSFQVLDKIDEILNRVTTGQKPKKI